MSLGSVDKFVIYKGFDSTFNFTIKQNGSTLPMTITSSDVFTWYLIPLNRAVELSSSSGGIVAEDIDTIVTATNIDLYSVFKNTIDVSTISSNNKLNGKIQISISALVSKRFIARSKTDDIGNTVYLPTYRLLIEADTTNNGKFKVEIPKVYVHG